MDMILLVIAHINGGIAWTGPHSSQEAFLLPGVEVHLL